MAWMISLVKASVPASLGASTNAHGNKSPSKLLIFGLSGIDPKNKCSRAKSKPLKNSTISTSWSASTSTVLKIIVISSPNSVMKGICKIYSRKDKSFLRMKPSPFSGTSLTDLEPLPKTTFFIEIWNQPTSSSKTKSPKSPTSDSLKKSPTIQRMTLTLAAHYTWVLKVWNLIFTPSKTTFGLWESYCTRCCMGKRLGRFGTKRI